MWSLLLVVTILTPLFAEEVQHCSSSDCSKESLNLTKQNNTCSQSVPIRSWKAKEPVGPSGDADFKVLYNEDLKLQVFVTKPSSDLDRDGFERAVRSMKLLSANFSRADLLEALTRIDYDTANTVVMFLDRIVEALVADDVTEILHKFQEFQTNIVFGVSRKCEALCSLPWPQPKPATAPEFASSRGFIGYLNAVKGLLSSVPSVTLKDNGDADKLLSVIFDEDTRSRIGIVLDYRGEIFQDLALLADDLNDAEFVLDFKFRGRPDTKLFARQFSTYPSIIRANGNRKLLNQIGNYIPLAWTPSGGCIRCNESRLCISESSHISSFPSILVDMTIYSRSPFLAVTLRGLDSQAYPKAKLTLFIHIENETDHLHKINTKIVNEWLAVHKDQYAQVIMSSENSTLNARKQALRDALKIQTQFVFVFDSLVRLTNNQTLLHLLQQNRAVIAPAVSRTGKLWSNFWGASIGDLESNCIDTAEACKKWAKEGECETNADYMSTHCMLSCRVCTPALNPWEINYKRSFDYLSIVEHERLGVWVVPIAFGVLLIRSSVVPSLVENFDSLATNSPANAWATSAVLASSIRKTGAHIHVSNLLSFGHLIDDTDYPVQQAHPDLYMIENNKPEWEEVYLHPNYSDWRLLGMANDSIDGHTCTDIYTFPLLSDRFCVEFIEEAEASNEWSTGDVKDKRLQGGYEPVPTRDIHFKQLGFKAAFRTLLLNYLAPVAQHHFIGYYMKADENLDFIVKYQPEGQAYLRPHQDASSVTIVVALNQRGVDFEGGGTKFIRQNCTVFSSRGIATLHPGRITHQHEGLQTTNGTRYILVSFIDQ